MGLSKNSIKYTNPIVTNRVSSEIKLNIYFNLSIIHKSRLKNN